ncbi:MAG: RNB domain-containing ribonuclease, partial [Bdellovibrionales bacterium]|nr:RNB domain-containing ribonuclease [Bdellovibrionales bacterium]
WVVINREGHEFELAAQRLTALPAPEKKLEAADYLSFLVTLNQAVEQLQNGLDLAAVWELLHEAGKESSVEELCDLLFGGVTLEHFLATRHALLHDQIYFKRRKSGFEARPPGIVEELKKKKSIEDEKQRVREQLISACLARLSDSESVLPDSIQLFENLAAFGSKAADAKAANETLDEVIQRAKLPFRGRSEDKAYQLLVRLQHFSAHQDLNLIRYQRSGIFPSPVIAEAERVCAALESSVHSERFQFADAFIITIDGEGTRDMDDALSIERAADRTRIGIHISDVSSHLALDGELDREARSRAISIYCPDVQIPMLPPSLSEHALSLIEGRPRNVTSFFIEVSDSGEVL